MIFGMSEAGKLTWKQVVGLGTAASLGRSSKYASGVPLSQFRPHEALI